MAEKRRLWLQFGNRTAVALAQQLKLGTYSAPECRAIVDTLPTRVLVEAHVPRSAAFSNFFTSCRWAEYGEEIQPGDVVILTLDWSTYYLVSI